MTTDTKSIGITFRGYALHKVFKYGEPMCYWYALVANGKENRFDIRSLAYFAGFSKDGWQDKTVTELLGMVNLDAFLAVDELKHQGDRAWAWKEYPYNRQPAVAIGDDEDGQHD